MLVNNRQFFTLHDLTVPVDDFADIKISGSEATGMFSYFPAVQPHGSSELRLVDLEGSEFLASGQLEVASVPDVIPVLLGYAAMLNQGAFWQYLQSGYSSPDDCLAVELVYVRERRA